MHSYCDRSGTVCNGSRYCIYSRQGTVPEKNIGIVIAKVSGRGRFLGGIWVKLLCIWLVGALLVKIWVKLLNMWSVGGASCEKYRSSYYIFGR